MSGARRRLIALIVGVALAGVLAVVLFAGIGTGGGGSPASNGLLTGNGPASQGAASESIPGVDLAGASLMNLNVVSSAQAQSAPAMNLVDQHGRPTTLSQFAGKVVIWSLNDDQCTDLCALFAEDVVAADKDLGPAAQDVVFLSVNANPYYPAPGAVEKWSETNDLASTPNWVYVTGTPQQLRSTWNAYKVTVNVDPSTRTVTHDAMVQFIDPAGKIRGYAYFDTGAISTAYYAHTMAQVADDLLPAAEQVKVGGPAVSAPSTKGATIGSAAPTFDLKALNNAPTGDLKKLVTKPTVLSFWASTCTACVQEMPALEQVARQNKGLLNVIGIDVSDPRSAAASFAAHLGVTYPLLADPDGATAAAYRVDQLPVTFVLAPGGSILARHEGGLTESQLEAVLQMEFQQLPQT